MVIASLLLLGCGLTAPKNDVGFADLGSPGIFDVDHTMTLSFGPTVLKFAALHVDDEPELQAMLRGLEGVRIKLYEIDGDAGRVARRLEKMSLKLRDQNWEPIALIREDDEQVHMLIKMKGNHIRGLTLLTSDSEEVVIINIWVTCNPRCLLLPWLRWISTPLKYR